MMTPCYIFDIDGTLADNSHRTHHLLKTPKDWDAYHKDFESDTPIVHACRSAADLSRYHQIVFCSGRHDGQRDGTQKWLLEHVGIATPLYMRREADHRLDSVIKKELLERIRKDGFEPVMVFDDRNQVVEMWRAAGIPCFQVAEGNF
jgi:phosphoglycolate phosphatase-like HAD superfamily hydrolase